VLAFGRPDGSTANAGANFGSFAAALPDLCPNPAVDVH
jgi:hypothetical protein